MTLVVIKVITVVQNIPIVITMKNTKPFQIRFPEEILDQLKAVADNQHTTSSEIVRRLVIDYIKK